MVREVDDSRFEQAGDGIALGNRLRPDKHRIENSRISGHRERAPSWWFHPCTAACDNPTPRTATAGRVWLTRFQASGLQETRRPRQRRACEPAWGGRSLSPATESLRAPF